MYKDQQSKSDRSPQQSLSARALAAAGDMEGARDVGALDASAIAVDRKIAAIQTSLVERLIYGPQPSVEELQAGGRLCAQLQKEGDSVFSSIQQYCQSKPIFTDNGKLSSELRSAVAAAGAYGLTIPVEFGGQGASYLELARLEETLAANGLGPVAVEISGQLTIGAGSLLGYGSDHQRKTFLPLIAEGTLMGFALTEVGTGVNAKKIQAYVEVDDRGDYRLFADGSRNKLWITNATFGAIVAVVARIGRDSHDIGLFIVQLPERNVTGQETDYEFSCTPSGVAAFTANHNSRLHFQNFPIPQQNRISGDGIEVLFYCLRLGRCMLATMSAGYQRMLARDASQFARERPGVGGLVINHELPQLAIGRMLGGSLQARALAFLALSQDAVGVELAGLRDFTKSAAAQTGVESMIACEHVLGGRAFAQQSRVNAARANLHLFGVVEGEDEMIRMGAVRDVTLRFTKRYLSSLLNALAAANVGADSQPVPSEQRLMKLGLCEFIKYPRRSLGVVGRLLTNPTVLHLLGWVARNAAIDAWLRVRDIVPILRPRAELSLPKGLRTHARFAQQELRALRWTYLRLSVVFQLQLTSAQIALQRLGQRMEWALSILALCHHAASQDESQQHVAELQCLLLRERLEATRAGLRTRALRRLRCAIAAVGQDVRTDKASLFADLPAEQHAHPWK